MYYTNGLIARLKFISNIEKINAAHFTISLLLQITSTKGATPDYHPDHPSTGVLGAYSSLYYKSCKNMVLLPIEYYPMQLLFLTIIAKYSILLTLIDLQLSYTKLSNSSKIKPHILREAYKYFTIVWV